MVAKEASQKPGPGQYDLSQVHLMLDCNAPAVECC